MFLTFVYKVYNNKQWSQSQFKIMNVNEHFITIFDIIGNEISILFHFYVDITKYYKNKIKN